MFHRLLTLIMKELQSLLQEPQTRIILILPVIFQMILFPLRPPLMLPMPLLLFLMKTMVNNLLN